SIGTPSWLGRVLINASSGKTFAQLETCRLWPRAVWASARTAVCTMRPDAVAFLTNPAEQVLWSGLRVTVHCQVLRCAIITGDSDIVLICITELARGWHLCRGGLADGSAQHLDLVGREITLITER